jgi:hypothetical protein
MFLIPRIIKAALLYLPRNQSSRTRKISPSRVTPLDVTLGVCGAGTTSPTHTRRRDMSKSQGKAAKTKAGYSQEKVLEMFLSGKSIAECAAAQKMSNVYAHRILSTKYTEQYEKEQAKRKASREVAKGRKAGTHAGR